MYMMGLNNIEKTTYKFFLCTGFTAPYHDSDPSPSLEFAKPPVSQSFHGMSLNSLNLRCPEEVAVAVPRKPGEGRVCPWGGSLMKVLMYCTSQD